jgi:hypothetical protein
LRVTVGVRFAVSVLAGEGFVIGDALCLSCGAFAALGFAALASVEAESVAAVAAVEVAAGEVAAVPAAEVVVTFGGSVAGAACEATISGCEPPTVVITL